VTFHRERVIAALEAKADRFSGYEVAVSDALASCERALAGLETWLAGADWPGARPIIEHGRHPDIVIPFGQPQANHQQARAWGWEVMAGEV
jgi:hypothetical protein